MAAPTLQAGDYLIPGQQYTFALVVNFTASEAVAAYYFKFRGIGDYQGPVAALPYVASLQLHGDESLGVLGAAEVTFTYAGDGSDTVSTVANDLVGIFDSVVDPVWNFRYAIAGNQQQAAAAAPTSNDSTLDSIGAALKNAGLTPGLVWGLAALAVVILVGMHLAAREI